MNKAMSISSKEFDKTSLNYSELFDEGLRSLQELSGEDWTDFNAHDPGITILEQLCYAITDAAYRSSMPINDLLIRRDDREVDENIYAFYSPEEVLCTHPATLKDLRRSLIDKYEKIQNVWINPVELNMESAQKLNGLSRVEILPVLNLQTIVKQKMNVKREDFAPEVKVYLEKIRNLGENFNEVKVLKNQDIEIHIEVHLYKLRDVNSAIAKIFLELFEYIHCPVQHYSLEEMLEDSLSMDEVFDGPILKRGFIKDDELKDKKKNLSVDELQHVVLQVEGVKKCIISSINNKNDSESVTESDPAKELELIDPDYFFNIAIDNDLRSLYKHLRVIVNEQEYQILDRDAINKLVYEIWSKKYRHYNIGASQNDLFKKGRQGKFLDPGAYHSIQNHFPMIYGIGKEGLSQKDPIERHAKAMQLKAYLLFFEQPLANYLAQLKNLSQYFNITYRSKTEKQTYFSQIIETIPNVLDPNENSELRGEKKSILNKLLFFDPRIEELPDSLRESKDTFLRRKNKIYDHMLARFGENLDELPWRVSRNLNMIRPDEDFREKLLLRKSELLRGLHQISGTKGESFYRHASDRDAKDSLSRTFERYSGLEQIIYLKTGIPERTTIKRSLIPDLKDFGRNLAVEETKKDKAEFNKAYKPLHPDDLEPPETDEMGSISIPGILFGKISFKALVGRTMNLANYMISQDNDEGKKVQVIFQKAPSRWIKLFSCDSEVESKYQISRLIDYFRVQNSVSEGFYVLDHILLDDFLSGLPCGFTFLNEDGQAIIQTKKDAWTDNTAERISRLKSLYKLAFAEGFLVESPDNPETRWEIWSKGSEILGTLILKDDRWQLEQPISKQEKDRRILEQEEELKQYDGVNLSRRMDEITQPELLGYYKSEGDQWQLMDKDGNLIASVLPMKEKKQTMKEKKLTLRQAYETVRGITRLFNDPSNKFGALKLKEIENYRKLGSEEGDLANYRPSQLIFQRKIEATSNLNYEEEEAVFKNPGTFDQPTEEGSHRIDESFFNMRISVVLPDWPARFQDKRFFEYLQNLIYERTPAHIAVNILRLNKKQMEVFERHYHNWEKIKVETDPGSASIDALRQPSFLVFDVIQKCNKEKLV